MNQERLERFKTLLSVPSKSRNEGLMIEHISSEIENLVSLGMNVNYYVDDMGNVYATKGQSNLYPCYVSHSDTVHEIDTIKVIEGNKERPATFGKDFPKDEVPSLYAVNNENKPTGIGGDDKAGIFICLELLRTLEYCKVAFFVSEEIGCVGSNNADFEFFDDVSFICQYDAPGDHLITEICSGVRLFEEKGEFIYHAQPLVEEAYGNPMLRQSHPYTDVMALKRKLPISCINLSCGYYNMHTKFEFIVIDDVERAINAGISISTLATKRHYFDHEDIQTYTMEYSDEHELYESTETYWLSDDVVVYDSEYEDLELTIENFSMNNQIDLTRREALKLYEMLAEKFDNTNQYKLF
jgi:di/tripeptidase